MHRLRLSESALGTIINRQEVVALETLGRINVALSHRLNLCENLANLTNTCMKTCKNVSLLHVSVGVGVGVRLRSFGSG